MGTPQPTADTVVTVRLPGAPVRLWVRSSELFHELLREFALMQVGHAQGLTLPGDLLAVMDELTTRYGALLAANNEQRESAAAARLDQVDVTFQMPQGFAPVIHRLSELLEAVDRHSEAGDLLTLPSPPAVQRFRRWFLGGAAAQLEGAPPQPWDGPLT